MKEQMLKIAKDLEQGTITETEAQNLLLGLFGVSCSKNLQQPKSRGCCSECGEGYDNEEEWLYNTECELCGHPIPEHLIVKRP